MTLNMTDYPMLRGLTADFTCFPLVNINKDEEDKDGFVRFFSVLALGALIVCAQSNSA